MKTVMINFESNVFFLSFNRIMYHFLLVDVLQLRFGSATT